MEVHGKRYLWQDMIFLFKLKYLEYMYKNDFC